MEKQPLTRSAFFWADGVIAAVSLVWTAHYLGDIYDGLSFGGFFALFLLLILCRLIDLRCRLVKPLLRLCNSRL